MKMRPSAFLATLFALGMACSVLAAPKAPPTSGTLNAAVPIGTFEGSPIDTTSFFPQINDEYVFHPIRPENPHQLPQLPGLPNNLTPGKVGDYLRIGSAQYWPAIGATGWTPPDPCCAVGKNNVVATVNSTIAFFDKQGNKTFEQTSADFFAGLGATSFQYDPKCRYDRAHDRFTIVYLEEADSPETSKVLFAVSATGDPNGVWYRYRIEAKLTISGNSYWLDYPGFGYNKDAFVVCGNMFGFTSGWAGVQFLVIPATPVLGGGAAVVYSSVDPDSASTQIGETIDPTLGTIWACAGSGGNALRVYAIQNLTGTPSITFTTTPVPPYQTPSFGVPSTSGEEVDPLDGRIFNVVVRNSHLLAAHCIQSGSMLVSRWYDVDVSTWPGSGSPNLIQSGEVGSDSVHYFSPAVTMNAGGDISMIFSGASTTVTADTLVAGRIATDPLGQMGTPAILQSSAGNDYSEWRWGDFFGCNVDPVDDTTFWGISMDVDASNDWRTQVFSWIVVSHFPGIQALALNPTAVIGGTPSVGTVTLTGIAPPGGMKVSLKSSNPKVASVPGTVTVANGQTQGTFNVRTYSAIAPTDVTITASSGKSSATAHISVGPVGIVSVTMNPSQVIGGNPSTGTVLLGGPAGSAGVVVALSVSNTAVASVEWSLTIPSGQTSGTFTVTTKPVGVTTPVTVQAASPGPTRYATLTLLPSVALAGISVSPATVKGGSTTTGTVSMTLAVPNDVVITLASGNAAATMPATVTVPKGAKSASFTVKTSHVKTRQIATLSALYNGVAQTTRLTINP